MISAGGPVFWILVIMALAAVVIYFERLLELRRARIDYADFLDGVMNILDAGNDSEALAMCEDASVPVANVVATAIRNRKAPARVLRDAVDTRGRAEIGRLERRLASLAIIGQVAPAVGLIGVIFGFIETVSLVNSTEIVSRPQLLEAAMSALVPAAMGLMVSVPVTVMHGSLRVRMDRVVVELEAAASRIVGYTSIVRENSK
jgi:biopolymer transport protein ExbB/TolQ